MKVSSSRKALASLLAMTMGAVYFAPDSQGDEVLLAERPRSISSRAEQAPAGAVGPSVLAIRFRSTDETMAAGGFAPQQWTPPPNPKPKAAAPEPAAAQAPALAPALPFRVLGRYEEDNQWAVFLQHNDQNLVVRVGDTIAGEYKVERLEGSILTLRYLPLDQTQRLDLGVAQ